MKVFFVYIFFCLKFPEDLNFWILIKGILFLINSDFR